MKRLGFSFILLLVLGLTLGVGAEEAPAPTLAPSASDSAAPAEDAQGGEEGEAVEIEALFEQQPEPVPMSCSEVCGSYHAPTQGSCNDIGCYGISCGAPNGWSSGTCTCYCSYCL